MLLTVTDWDGIRPRNGILKRELYLHFHCESGSPVWEQDATDVLSGAPVKCILPLVPRGIYAHQITGKFIIKWLMI